MNMRNLLSRVTILCMGIAVAGLSFGGNPAHAGPAQSVTEARGVKMGTVTDKVNLNLQRGEAAKRLKARRAASAAETKKKGKHPRILKEVPHE